RFSRDWSSDVCSSDLTSKGTSTDIQGNYVLEDVPDDAVLVFNLLGFRIQEIPVNGREMIHTVMRTENSRLDEVVVIGYGTQLSKIGRASWREGADGMV